LKLYKPTNDKYRQPAAKQVAVYQNITGNEGPSPLMMRYLSTQRRRHESISKERKWM